YVFLKNEIGIYLTYNDYGAINLGYSKGAEIAGNNDFEIFPREVALLFRENDRQVITQESPLFVPEKGVLKDNFPVIFLSYKMPLYDQDKLVVGILGLA